MKILLAIDGSDSSQAAIQSVIRRPWPAGTEVRVLNVVEPPSLLMEREMASNDPEFEAVWKALREQAKDLVSKAAEKLKAAKLNSSPELAEGDPKSLIIDAANEWGGGHDRGRLARAQRPQSLLDGQRFRSRGPSRPLFRGGYSKAAMRHFLTGSRRSWFPAALRAVLVWLFLTFVLQTLVEGLPAQQNPARTKIAEGEYAYTERDNSGAVGPFEEEVYKFRESWTLWRVGKEKYEVEGVRRFESPKDEPHSNPFTADLTRDWTIIRVKEFSKLRWVPDSGPLSCEFLPKEMDCSSGGSDPKKEIKLRTPLKEPYGLLWPIAPFSFTGIARQVEREPTRTTQVDLVTIEQPGMSNPVQAKVLEGPIHYLGEENIEAAGRVWKAHKFSLEVASRPEYLIWTSPKGLLLAFAVEHAHKDWPEEGMHLMRFESAEEF